MIRRTVALVMFSAAAACGGADREDDGLAPVVDAGMGGQQGDGSAGASGATAQGGQGGSAGGVGGGAGQGDSGVGGAVGVGGAAGTGGAAGAAGAAGSAGAAGAAGACTPFSTAGRTWSTGEVDYIGGAPIYPDLALGSDGHPVVAFTKGTATTRWAAVTKFDGVAWSEPDPVETVPGKYLGKRPSLAVEPNGTQHVLAYDEDDTRPRYGRKTAGGTWEVETLWDTGNSDSGDHSSLSLDHEGNLHASFLEYGTYHLIYGVLEKGGDYHFLALSDQSYVAIKAGSTSLFVDGAGLPHIAYYTGVPEQHLHVARSTVPPSWVAEEADTTFDSGHYPSIVVDSQGTEWVAYLLWPDEVSEVRVASREGGAWKVRTVDTGLGLTYTTGIALLPCGGVGIAYARNEGVGQPGLWFAYKNPGDAEFTKVSVDDSSYVSGIDLAADETGRVHLVYLDETNYLLKYAVLQ